MNTFATDQRFDRVVSVEMFEHMRNWPRLLQRISHWLKDDGRLFIHIFVHRCLAYLFTKPGTYSWMGEHFFKEGMMPSEALLHVLNRHLFVEHCWRVNGRHYARTLHAWLDQFDRNAAEARTILAGHHGVPDARVFFGRWRMFFMACEELFAYRGGDEWYVAHYLLRKPSPTAIG
jgi:cyclopropane-fatty-acyl-phospholipid synthase